MRPLLLLLPVFALLLAATALLAAPDLAGPPRGSLPNRGLDHWEQQDPPPELQPTPPAPRGPAPVEVALRDGFFEPGETSAPEGSPVRFVNRGTEAHTVTGRAQGASATEVDRVLQPGEETVLGLGPGTHEFRCRFHSPGYGAGMAAQVIIG